LQWFDDKILSLYARGMTVREIQGYLEEMYGTEVSPSLISSVTDAVIDEVKIWQSRPQTALLSSLKTGCRSVKENPFTQNSGHPPCASSAASPS
jgi:putative transposase